MITTESGCWNMTFFLPISYRPPPVPFSSYPPPIYPESALLTTYLPNAPSTDHHTLLSGTYFNLLSGTSFLTLKRVCVAWFLKPFNSLFVPSSPTMTSLFLSRRDKFNKTLPATPPKGTQATTPNGEGQVRLNEFGAVANTTPRLVSVFSKHCIAYFCHALTTKKNRASEAQPAAHTTPVSTRYARASSSIQMLFLPNRSAVACEYT